MTPQLSRDVRPHSILEPIHGLVRFTDAEFAVLNHPLFRRLRKIKQNGLLYLVFPSATHNRFEHSIGAMNVADAMLEQIWLNSVVARRKNAVEGYTSQRGDVAIDFSQVHDPVMRWVVRITRLAALVHDLGHGALSHTFDSFALFRDDLQQLLAGGVVPQLVPVAKELSNWGRKGVEGSVDYDRVPHEVMSCVFFAHVWSSPLAKGAYGNAFDGMEADSVPLAVAAAILGEPNIAAPAIDAERLSWLHFIHDLIASAPADADRMDYLERDSRGIGVTYGLFDRNRVMKSLLCYRHGEGDNAAYRLGVKRSGIPAIENFIQARYELFVQVYFHKTNRAISLMLEQLAREARRAKYRLFDTDPGDVTGSFQRLVDAYIDLSDDQFLRVLRGVDTSYPSVPDEAQRIASAIDNREIWKRLYEGDGKGAREVHNGLQAEFGSAISEEIYVDVSDPKATKDLDNGASLLAKGNDGVYAPLRQYSWRKSSIIVEALSEAEADIGRVYAKGDTLKESRRKELAQSARRLGGAYEMERDRRREKERRLMQELRLEVRNRLMRDQGESLEGADQ